jgi:exonuclease VII small subunit
MRLAKACRTRLEAVELKVARLLAPEEGEGAPETLDPDAV